jgi:magnesium-transporting ATPase (P-type)
MLRILLLASLVSLVIGILQEGLATGWIEGTAIFFAVFMVVLISSIINYNKEKEFNKLSRLNKPKDTFVKRIIQKDGKLVAENKVKISTEDLLVGDINYVGYGDVLKVDGILLEGDIQMDESALTGESILIRKKPEFENTKIDHHDIRINPFLLSGSMIKEGEGIILVTNVGKNTYSSRLAETMSAPAEMTDLQVRLTDLADRISGYAYYVATFIGLIMVAKQLLINLSNGLGVFDKSMIDALINGFVITVTVIVVAVPEGLPMAVTISLAYSLREMYKLNNFVKHLDASETMGNVDIVCTDKTGTLTKGIMLVNRIYALKTEYGKPLDKNVKNKMNEIPLNKKDLIVETIYNNVGQKTLFKEVEGKMTVDAVNDTEKALMEMILENGYNAKELKKQEVLKALPFNSTFKMMVNICKHDNGKVRIYLKGAPDQNMKRCSLVLTANGNEVINHDEVNGFITKFAQGQMRTILMAYKELSEADYNNALNNMDKSDDGAENVFFDTICSGLTLVAIAGIIDEPREDVPQAVLQCQQANVDVLMVTGDFITTAMAIAVAVNIMSSKQLNEATHTLNRLKELYPKTDPGKVDPNFGSSSTLDISKLSPNDKIYAIEGEMFKNLVGGYEKIQKVKDGEEGESKNVEYEYVLKNPNNFARVVRDLKVIARATPDHKFLLVTGLKQIKRTVAVTGDGTNDAPALKNANVGFAMGQKGTDVAKEAADIILLDDSFSSIITAIKFGRNVYDCIRKFIQFQLTTNVVAVFMTLLGGIILKDSPLNSIQMLWVNLIMDSFASLALATEPPSDALLNRKPYPKDAEIVSKSMYINVVTQAIFQIIVLTVIIFYGDIIFDVPSDRELTHFTWNDINGYHFTIFFNIFVFLQVFNSINARKLGISKINVFENMFNNGTYLLVQGIIIGGQVILVQLGGRAVRTHALTLWQHLGCLLIASLSLVTSAVSKLILRRFVEDDDEVDQHPKKMVQVGTMKGGAAFMKRLSRTMSTKLGK